jgi:D-alanyl-D-alanine carboxypeptidase/D-alanyl-D-alanine-endopeptidase (penicillin-binding protein 4)
MRYCLFIISIVSFFSCTSTRQIAKSARETVLNDEALQTAHVGISIYEPATGKYLYNYQGDKYFVPASNTKLPTCYAAMKYLGDSLVAARVKTNNSSITIYPTGDPTFLHPDFLRQPLMEKLKLYKRVDIVDNAWQDNALGSGWAWGDFNESYMAERSSFPIYGNLLKFYLDKEIVKSTVRDISIKSSEVFESPIRFNPQNSQVSSINFRIERLLGQNVFFIKDAATKFSSVSIPFRTTPDFIINALKDTLKTKEGQLFQSDPIVHDLDKNTIIHSQPTDSLLKPMMHRSDNFFAEQSLLMVSNELLGFMNDSKIIDTLLKTDFKGLPQKPRWVDGSGLSRYNLFSPQDLVFILNKMKTDFGMERIKNILPTGNEGTLGSRFVTDSNYIFAKTGTLSGVVALSGFLYTRKNKMLIFSVLVNNHNSSASGVRNAVEKFIHGIREKY